VILRSGDFILLPHADGHTIRSEPGREAHQRFEAAVDFTPRRNAQTFKWAADDGAAGSFLAGSFYFDGAPLRSLLTGLPGLIHLTCDKVSERLIDLLVIRTLRMWVNQRGERVGWLSGLSDERVGRALNAMHSEPGHAWTVSALAEMATMSRSTFSDRFTAVVGLPPLRYLTRWRLTIAADLLRRGSLKVTEVAHSAGYGSEAAFSRAFKEEFGYPPRDAHRIAQAGAFVARSSELP
jgi:AraC-like DNA-binding protein